MTSGNPKDKELEMIERVVDSHFERPTQEEAKELAAGRERVLEYLTPERKAELKKEADKKRRLFENEIRKHGRSKS